MEGLKERGIGILLKKLAEKEALDVSTIENGEVSEELNRKMSETSLEFRQKQIKSQIEASKTYLTF